jgi:hypothetical protein
MPNSLKAGKSLTTVGIATDSHSRLFGVVNVNNQISNYFGGKYGQPCSPLGYTYVSMTNREVILRRVYTIAG